LFFAALLGASLSPVMHWSFLRGGLTGLTIGLAGLIGDLSESSWKRALGLKDFSAGLGAQGGFLDRFDALIFAAPIFFLLLGI
jgi:phosphatidate cytidylyltransferase